MARASKSLASTLQRLIDKYKDASKLMLILCGSSMPYMEDHVLAYKAPLYGRRTAQIKLLPFTFEEVCRYFNDFSLMSEISSKVGEETNVCAAYLKNLLLLGSVRKETPYGEKASKRSVYIIEDNIFRFWYRFVPENNSIIARGAASLAYKRIEPLLNDYKVEVFEEICAQYFWVLLLAEKSPVRFASLGRWWGNDPRTKKQAVIDIMGEQDKKTVLFAEGRWTN